MNIRKSQNMLAIVLTLVMLMSVMVPAAYADDMVISSEEEPMILLGSASEDEVRTGSAIGDDVRTEAAIYWTDGLTVQPEGFVTKGDENVEISSPDGLAWLAVMTLGLNGQTANTFEGKTITLTKDIDLSAKKWTPIGRYEVKLVFPPFPPQLKDVGTPFKGTFDGDNHTISGLTMSTFPDSIVNKYYGLFATVRDGSIKNVHLSNVDMNITKNIGVASLVGYLDNSTMENCTVNGNLKGYHLYGLVDQCVGKSIISKSAFNGTISAEYTASGICNNLNDGTIDQCYVNAVVDCGNSCSSGICIKLSQGRISNCYTIGSIIDRLNAGSRGGGICGSMSSNCILENCYSTMTLKGADSIGGISGSTYDDSSSVVRGCVALNDTITAEYLGTRDSLQGRVIGDVAGEKTEIKTNYAYTGMKVYSRDVDSESKLYLSGLLADECIPSKKQGEDITADDLANGWPVNNWDADIWNFETGNLPILKKLSDQITQTGEMPAHINADSEGNWNITAFDELTIDIPEVTLGTSSEDAAALLPKKIYATKDGTTAVRIPDITWMSSDFDGSTVGEYTFTAALPDGYTAKVDLPAQKVKVVLKYTVTFDTNGADEIEAVGLDNGSLITKPDDPTRQGFTFGGWYKDEDYSEAWDFANHKVTASVTLYAKWSIDGDADYIATESGVQPTLDVSKMGFENASIVSISDVDGDTTYAVVEKQKINFFVPIGKYVIASTGNDVGAKTIIGFNQNEGVTPAELCYKGNGTAEEPYTMLGTIYIKDGSVAASFHFVDVTFRILSEIAGYNTEGKINYETPYCVKVEDRGGDGSLNASYTIDGSRLMPCANDGWFRSPRKYGVVLDPSDILMEDQFNQHTLYSTSDYPERRQSALEKLKAVRADEKRVLMVNTQFRDFPGPMTYKLDVSGYFENGNTVNINYLLGAANNDIYHGPVGSKLEEPYMLAMEPIYFKNNTSAVVTDGYITFDMYNGGYFELVKPKNDNTETKYVAEFVTNNLINSYDTLYPSTIHPQILDVSSGYKVTKPVDPTIEDYTFGGWYTDKAFSTEFDFNVPLTQNVILYAKWIGEENPNDPGSGSNPGVEEFTVTFVTGKDPDTGKLNATIDAQKVEKGKKAKDPGFFDNGYGDLVLGWYTDQELKNEYDFDDAVTSNLTLYPKWMRYILKDDLESEGGSGTESDPYLAHLADSRQSKIAWKALNKLAGKSQWWQVYVTEDNEEDGDTRYKWEFNCKDIKNCNRAQPYYTDISFSKKKSNSVQVDLVWRTAIEGKVYISMDVSKYFRDDAEVEISYVKGSCDGKVAHTNVETGEWVDSKHHPKTYYTTGTAEVDDGFITLELTHGGSYTLTSDEVIADTIDPDSKKEDISVSIKPKVTAKDGSAAFSVSYAEIQTAVKSAAEKKADVIVISPKVTGEANKFSAQFYRTYFKEIVDSTDSDVMLKTDLGCVTISKDALAKIVAKDGEKVAINIEKASEGTIKVEVKIDDKKAEGIGNVKIAVPAKNAGHGMVAVLVNEDGSEKIIKKSVLKDNEMLAMIDGSATVKLVDKSKNFNDVENSFWGKEAIGFATSHELFQGVSETQFGKNEAMTRSMLVTVLHRLEDMPEGRDTSFNDVNKDNWYTEAVAWATEKAIVTGTGNSFNPGNNITREQIAVILYRYAKHIGADTSVRGDISQFNDGSQVSDWSEEAMMWIVGSGLMKGKDGNVLDPAGDATRAEVAVTVQRFVSKILD